MSGSGPAGGEGEAAEATEAGEAADRPRRTGRRKAGTGDDRSRDYREITDPRTMRAMAHPMRLALLEALRREGPLTATRAAELLDDSPGNMSWHLQTLAKYGFVEEAGGGRGRSRPWRVVSLTYNFETALTEPEHAAAGEMLEATFQERNLSRLREWWRERRSYPAKWRQAAFSADAVTYLTVEELQQLGDEINVILGRYRPRTRDKERRPPDALPVHLVAYGHPLPPTPSGN
jgi:DNA-binding transcriptional ArsR family regulator